MSKKIAVFPVDHDSATFVRYTYMVSDDILISA